MTPDEARQKAGNLVTEVANRLALTDAQCVKSLALVDIFAAALLEAAGEWRTMDQHDGGTKEVLGIDANGIVEVTWFFAPSSMTRDWRRYRDGKPWKPTHYRDLPAPPDVPDATA